MSDDDECIHLNNPALCTICNGKDAAGKRVPRPVKAVAKIPTRASKAAGATAAASSKRLTTSVVSPTSLDTPESVEEYRAKYPADRQDTFDAYVLVFFNTEERDFPGGFAAFSRCASADPERKETAPALVARAERAMRKEGYELDDSGRPLQARRWFKED